MFAQTLKFNRGLAYLLALSLATMALSLACGHCLAALAGPVVHTDGPLDACHAGGPQTGQSLDSSAKCPSMEAMGHQARDWTPGSLNHETGQSQAAVVAGIALGIILLAIGAFSPGFLPVAPPFSLIRRFCIQLE